MVGSHSQHQRSSPIACFFKLGARTLMDAAAASASAAASAGAAASPGGAEHERDSDELGAEPTAALAAEQAAGGPPAASAEAIIEPTAGGERIDREVVARPRRSGAGVADPGKDLLDEITALKEEQRKAKEKKLAITKDLRNANRRRQRLKKRAKALSDSDLLAVISLRNHEKALGRQLSAEEDDDEGSESELDEQPNTGSAHSDAPSPARPKKRARN